jgi:hypothetical protein
MVAKHLPRIEQKIKTLTELQGHHEDIARQAQTEEEAAGDISHECEEKTHHFTRRYSKMKRIHGLMMSVHRHGALSPQLLNTLLHHFKFFYDAEVENVKKYKSALALEKFLDNLFHHHSELASHLKIRRLTLLRSRKPKPE